MGCQIIYIKDEWLIWEKEITFDSVGVYGNQKSWAWIFKCLVKIEHKIISYHSWIIEIERSDM